MHYSVTESAGSIEVTILKKNNNQECTFGVKTIQGTAKPQSEYEHVDEIVTMRKKESQKVLNIKIFDNQEWQPDLDFFVDIYDPQALGMPRLYGDDT